MDRSRCPACSATLRPDAQWCSLCYLDLRPPPPQPEPVVLQPMRVPVPAGVSMPTPRATPARAATATSAASAQTAAGWPCTSCATVVPLDVSACPDCGATFLGRLAGDGGRHRHSGTPIKRLPRSARLAAGVLAGIVIAVLIPVLLALLG